jgi:hypothetical protein
LVIQRRKHKKYDLKKASLKLMTVAKYLQIKKGYNFYIKNNSPWPRELLSKLNSDILAHSLNYKNLEFFNHKDDRTHSLKSYSLLYPNLSDYLPLLNFKYTSANKDFIWFMNKINKYKMYKSPKKYTNEEYFYYWLLPLRRYFINLTRTTDIIGLRFRIRGRPYWRRNNNRKISNIYDRGSRSTTQHYSRRIYKYIPLAVSRTRGYLKSQTQCGSSIDKSKNGAVGIKVWVSSLIAVDVLELLLHLVRIKDLYSQLLYRYFGKKAYNNKKKNKFLRTNNK